MNAVTRVWQYLLNSFVDPLQHFFFVHKRHTITQWSNPGLVNTDVFSKVCDFISKKMQWKYCVHMIVFTSFVRPHGNDENDWKRFQPSTRICRRRYLNLWAKTFNCQFTTKLNRSEIPIKTAIRSLSISSILDFSNESGLGLRSRDQSFSKVCVFSEFDPSTRSRYFLRFQIFPLWRVFSKVCVFIVFVWTGHENASVWTWPQSWKVHQNKPKKNSK